MPSTFQTNLLYKLDAEPRASTREGAPPYYSVKFKIGPETCVLFLNDGTLEAEYAKTLAKGAPITVSKDDKGYKLLMPADASTPSVATQFRESPQVSPSTPVSAEDLEKAKEEARQARNANAKELCGVYAAIYHNLKAADVASEHLQGAASTVFITATRP